MLATWHNQYRVRVCVTPRSAPNLCCSAMYGWIRMAGLDVASYRNHRDVKQYIQHSVGDAASIAHALRDARDAERARLQMLRQQLQGRWVADPPRRRRMC